MSDDIHSGDLLRLVTAGSVDDGKSTLIGRLLYEAGGVFEDQLDSIKKLSSTGQTNSGLDLSLITDGLRAEREQCITIDVAYRYFATTRRKFIIADVPGHSQYTRNMVTGASTADLAVLLVDVRKGVLHQTKRHVCIASLLGIRHFVFAINKMDLVGFDQGAFESARQECQALLRSIENRMTHFVPVSATQGDNIVQRSARMSWYNGQSLLSLLESIEIADETKVELVRLPVQNVIRPHQDFRGYAGQIASGRICAHQEVVALPSMHKTTIEGIFLHPRELTEAAAPLSVVVTLKEQVDLGRGDMLADPRHPPEASQSLVVRLIWLSETPMAVNRPYLVRHTTQIVCGSVVRVESKTNVETLQELPANLPVSTNDLCTAIVETHRPLFCDRYCDNRITGSIILIDPKNNGIAGAGIIVEPNTATSATLADQIALDPQTEMRLGLTVWLTGLSGAGKSSIAAGICTELLARGIRVELLDADELRKHLNKDLGFSKQDRDENVRRIGFVASLLTRNGIVAIVSAISPYRAVREEMRRLIGSLIEVYVDAPLEVCERRDPKGLYRRARRCEITGFTGIDDPYEPPLAPNVVCRTADESLKESIEKVLSAIFDRLPVAKILSGTKADRFTEC